MNLPELAVAAALAWGAGLRAYAVIFLVGLAGTLGWVELPQHLRLLEHPLVLGASGFMTAVEFFADKLPWLDSVWDAVHSFIRIPAGAALAAAVFGDSGGALTLAAAILGGTLAAGVHLAKAGTRAAINTSPEPLSNWTASLAEDAMVPAGLWLAVAHPVVFFVLLAVFLVAAALLVRFIWRGLRNLLDA
ncbi:MAG: DUF4126 domain-containing protein [Burkholderiales bacterium]